MFPIFGKDGVLNPDSKTVKAERAKSRAFWATHAGQAWAMANGLTSEEAKARAAAEIASLQKEQNEKRGELNKTISALILERLEDIRKEQVKSEEQVKAKDFAASLQETIKTLKAQSKPESFVEQWRADIRKEQAKSK